MDACKQTEATGFSTPQKRVVPSPHRSSSLSKASSPLRSLAKESLIASKAFSLGLQPCLSVTKEQVVEWLEALDLAYLLNYPRHNCFLDPAKNGVLIAKIADKVVGPVTYFEEPRTVEDVRHNVTSAFDALSQDNASLPDLVTNYPEGLMQGWDDCFWSFLKAVAGQYPTTGKDLFKSKHLPYSSYQSKALRVNLLSWVNSLLKRTFSSFDEIAAAIRQENLLAEIVHSIIPFDWQSLRPGDQTWNIEQCLKALRAHARMSVRYIWSAQALLHGDDGYLLGLLEDLHRLKDQSPPRPRQKVYTQTPYFGDETNYKYSNLIDQNAIRNAYRRFRACRRSVQSICITHFTPSKPDFVYKKSDITVEPQRPLPDNPVQTHYAFRWLRSIGVQPPADLNRKVVESFRSGHLLTQIVEKLERQKIAGTTRGQETSGAQYQRIQRAFEVLKRKHGFHCDVTAMQIHEGHGGAVRKLLEDIQRVYRATVFMLDRTTRPGSCVL